MTPDDSGPAASRNWRDPSSYDDTRHLTREGWALEFLERNQAYAALARELRRSIPRTRRAGPQLTIIEPPDTEF